MHVLTASEKQQFLRRHPIVMHAIGEINREMRRQFSGFLKVTIERDELLQQYRVEVYGTDGSGTCIARRQIFTDVALRFGRYDGPIDAPAPTPMRTHEQRVTIANCNRMNEEFIRAHRYGDAIRRSLVAFEQEAHAIIQT